MPFPILAAAGLAGGLIKGLFGGSQRREGRRILADNPYPTYNIPTEVMENKRLAQQAQGGMPAAQYAQASQNIQRQQLNALRGASSRRGALGLIGGIQRSSNDAALGLDVANAKMARENQQTLMNVNNQVAGYRDKAFDWNQKNKYLQNRAYGMGLIGAGNQNIAGGIDTALGGFVNQYAFGGGGLFGNSSRRKGGGADNTDYFGLNSGTDY